MDRAANKRKYLVVKHAPVSKDGPPPPSSGAPQPPGPPAQPPTPAPPTLRISPELKAQVLGVLTTAQEQIGIITKVLEGSSETPGAPPPPELMDALTKLAALLQPPAAPPAATPPAPAAPPPAAAAKDEAIKAGKKISAARLAQLNSVRATLDALVSDVSGAAEEEEAAEAAELDPKAPAKKGSGEAPAPAPAEPNEAEKPKPAPVKDPAQSEPTQPVQTPPNQDLVEIRQSIAGLCDTMGKMTKVLEAQNARVESLSKSRGQSLQGDVDAPVNKGKQDRVVWDLDMARPLKNIQ